MRFIQGDRPEATAIERFHARRRRAIHGPGDFDGCLAGRFIDVCNAIAYAHSRGVLHRDLKPGNIMLGPFGETLVVDWGLAKVIGRATTVDHGDRRRRSTQRCGLQSGTTPTTVTGQAVGTPAYMSPEQAAGKLDDLGPASDVYSLGATLYVLLTDHRPFDGDPSDILRDVQRGQYSRAANATPSSAQSTRRNLPKGDGARTRRTLSVGLGYRRQTSNGGWPTNLSRSGTIRGRIG